MPETTKTTKPRAARKTTVKKDDSANTDLNATKSAVARLQLRVDALEAKCAKLEKAKTAPSSGGGISDERWNSLKLFLEKKFGRELLKSSGVWFK